MYTSQSRSNGLSQCAEDLPAARRLQEEGEYLFRQKQTQNVSTTEMTSVTVDIRNIASLQFGVKWCCDKDGDER